MDMMSLRRRIMGAEKTLLPREYQQVEYLRATGTQWIDTGITFGENDFVASCQFVLPSYYGGGEYPIMSIWTNQYYYWNCFIRVTNSAIDLYTAGHNLLDQTINEGEMNNVEVSRTGNEWGLSNNGVSKSWNKTPSSVNNTTFKLFTRGDAQGKSKIDIYSVVVTISEEPTANLIPCYRKSDQKPGMYDLVSGEFYTNSGTGEFVVGSDV